MLKAFFMLDSLGVFHLAVEDLYPFGEFFVRFNSKLGTPDSSNYAA